MQYEDFYALELEAEMIDADEKWLTEQDEMYLEMIEEWERLYADRRWS